MSRAKFLIVSIILVLITGCGVNALNANQTGSKTKANPAHSVRKENLWVFYANPDDGYTIYRKKQDGSQQKKIGNDERVDWLQSNGNWVYFTLLDDNGYELFKMKSDGTLKQLICNVDFLGNPAESEVSGAVYSSYIVLKSVPLAQPTFNAADTEKERLRVQKDTHIFKIRLDGSGYTQLR